MLRASSAALWSLVVVVAAGCSDSRCSLENCRKLITCKVALTAEPTSTACAEAGSAPANFDFDRYCPAACQATGAGAAVKCVADKSAECGASGASVATACFAAPTTPLPDPACVASCDSKRTACEARCPKTSFATCMDCAATCGLDWAACSQACPKS